jgi:hypothetical protein
MSKLASRVKDWARKTKDQLMETTDGNCYFIGMLVVFIPFIIVYLALALIEEATEIFKPVQPWCFKCGVQKDFFDKPCGNCINIAIQEWEASPAGQEYRRRIGPPGTL